MKKRLAIFTLCLIVLICSISLLGCGDKEPLLEEPIEHGMVLKNVYIRAEDRPFSAKLVGVDISYNISTYKQVCFINVPKIAWDWEYEEQTDGWIFTNSVKFISHMESFYLSAVLVIEQNGELFYLTDSPHLVIINNRPCFKDDETGIIANYFVLRAKNKLGTNLRVYFNEYVADSSLNDYNYVVNL